MLYKIFNLLLRLLFLSGMAGWVCWPGLKVLEEGFKIEGCQGLAEIGGRSCLVFC